MLQKNTVDWMRQQLNGFVGTQIIAAATTLSLVDNLQNGPRTVEEIASITGLEKELTFRLLRSLAAIGLVARQLRHWGLIYLTTTCITPTRLRSSKRRCK